MKTRNLFIVALAGSSCLASAQYVNQAPAPRPVYHPASHPAPPPPSSYHPESGSAGSHGYQNYQPSGGSGAGLNGGLGNHSLQPTGFNEAWHGDQRDGYHPDQHEAWRGDQRDGYHPDQHEAWRGDEHRGAWRGDEHRDAWRGDEHPDFWRGDEHRDAWRNPLDGDGWWKASHMAHDFGAQASATGKEYFAAASKIAENFPGFGGVDQTAKGIFGGFKQDGEFRRTADLGLPWESYWSKIPTIAWLKDRIAYIEESAWNWK